MIQARKRFGQNFLHDRHIIDKIIKAVRPESREHLIEIGPGRGALTFPLLERTKQFSAIEIDRDLIKFLKDHAPREFNLIAGDALKINLPSVFPGVLLHTVVGNLPYNISTPLLFHLLAFRDYIDEMFFMLQKEVVLRMAASPGSKEYGRLSVMVQYCCEVEPLFQVPPGAFTPPPQVNSMMVRLKPYTASPYGEITNLVAFNKIVQLAFNQRRKTLHNALKSASIPLPTDLAGKRAEELSIKEYVALVNSAYESS